MENVVYFESDNKVGCRPQVFKEWTVGTRIICNGDWCVIKGVYPNTEEGLEEVKALIRMTKVFRKWVVTNRNKTERKRLLKRFFEGTETELEYVFSMKINEKGE